MLNRKCFFGLLVCLLFGACAIQPSGRPAPIENKTGSQRPGFKTTPSTTRSTKAAPNRDPDTRPQTHMVAKGETLYSLALEYGLDYKELALWNALEDANLIKVGQVLRLTEPDGTAENGVQVKALTQSPLLAQPLESVVSQPKALKIPYSETAAVELKKAMAAPPTISGNLAVTPVPLPIPAKPILKPETKVETRPEASASTASSASANNAGGKLEKSSNPDDELLEWVWPTQGKLLSRYNEKGNKGIDIGGRKGQEIFSASVGKVVYSGVGLRGYGKLVIIKHNKTYLSAYAHNQTVLVKEGDSVAKGQKIAEMGDSDSDVVKLHFEIRRFGKPVDPSKYLPAESAL